MLMKPMRNDSSTSSGSEKCSFSAAASDDGMSFESLELVADGGCAYRGLGDARG
jgi:hypothetical protein